MIAFAVELRRQASPDLLAVNLRERAAGEIVTRSLCLAAQGLHLSFTLTTTAPVAAPVWSAHA